jgi:hypothetical protein
VKLDRDLYPLGLGKYGLILVRKLREPTEFCEEIRKAIGILEARGILDWGCDPNDFFVIRLKDKYAQPALDAYAAAALKDDPEYAMSVRALANKAMSHPDKQRPD